jgi:2',3'-cyclic-nucleotide 2'-phosphodiesterase
MKIIFFGDIVGKIGRQSLALIMPQIKEEYQPDVILANVENLAHGKGITAKTLAEIRALGIDCFTSGNHIWKKENVLDAADASKSVLITPANDPRTPEGQGYYLFKVGSKSLLVVNLLGRVFIDEQNLSCPFKTMEKILDSPLAKKASVVFLDFHAEATSEKIALGWYLDGRVGAVLGTHTHVPTSDFKILPKGTAYVTDVGMVGPVDSVLGVEKEIIIEKFLTDSPIVFDIPENGEVEVNAVYLELDDQTGLAKKIEKIIKKVIV